MKNDPSPLDSVMALYLAKIIANQEQMIKMLSEIIANDTGREGNEIYNQHIKDARKMVPELTNYFLNQLAAKDYSPPGLKDD